LLDARMDICSFPPRGRHSHGLDAADPSWHAHELGAAGRRRL